MANKARASAPTTKLEAHPADTFDVTKARLVRRGPLDRFKHGVRLSLAGIRKALDKTQVELAEKGGLEQSEVSRLERRDDALVSTIERYAKGLGGKVEVTIVMPTGHRFIVDMKGE